jgi:hypothetical protein
MIYTLFIHGHRLTFKHLCWHSITKILRNGPRAHFPFNTGQCPVLQQDAALELASLGILRRLLRYNSPDMSGVHRTVRCFLGATAISAPTATCDALNTRAAHADVRHAYTGTPDIQQYMSGVHRTSRRAQKSEAPTVRIKRHW